MTKRLSKSVLAILLSLCLLLAAAVMVAFVSPVRVQAAEGATTTKYITTDGTLSDSNVDGSIAVDVDADGTLVFNKIEQFNAVENNDVEGATTYTIKPYGYNYDGGIIVYPAFQKQIAEYIFNQSASMSSAYKFTINTSATLKWRVVVPATVTQIADFSFAYWVEGRSSTPGVTTYNKIYGWNCSGSGTTPVGAAGMVGLEFEKGDTDYDLKLGAGIIGANAIKSLEIPARVTQMVSAPTPWTTEEFNAYYTDDIKNDTSDIRYLNENGTTYARGRLEKVLTGSYSGVNSSYASSYVAMDKYHIGTFSDCYAETVTFEENGRISEIPAYSFVIAAKATSGNSFYLPKLTTLTLSNNITSIGDYTFVNNYCLRNVDLKNVQTIGTYAFSYCFTYSPKSVKGNLITMGSDKDEEGAASIVLPDTLTTIATKAFYICPGLTSITVGSGLTTLATDSFSGSLALPTKIAEIRLSDDALKNWMSIDFGTKNCLITSTDTEMYLNDEPLTDLVIPEGVTAIGNCAFANYTKLKTVDAGSELQEIGANAFSGCSGLNSFTFPDKNAEPGSEYMVDGVDSALTKIGANAFSNSALQSFVVPASVTSIGSSAFANCTSLSEVFNLSETDYSFGSGVTVKDEYHGDTSLVMLGDFVFKTEDDDGTTLDTPILIGYNGQAEAVTLPDRYEGKKYDIVKEAFKDNGSIMFLRIPAGSVGAIGASAFEGALKLQSVIIDNGIDEIGERAFYGCSELVSVVIRGAISSIKNYAFFGCDKLNAFNINDSQLLEIGHYAFYGCSELVEIVMPDSVTTIGQYAFCNCSSLSNLKLSASITAIPNNAFANTALGELVIPDSVTEIGANAFSYANLTELYIGSGVTTMGYSAFANNGDLAVIEFAPDSALTTLGGSVFAFCNEVKRLAYPDSVRTIGDGRIIGTASWSHIVELRLPASYVVRPDNQRYDLSGTNNNISVYLPEVNDGNRTNYGANMLGFLVRISSMTGDNGKLFTGIGCIIAPDKEAYDLMASAINSFNDSAFNNFAVADYIGKLYALGDVTYTLSDKDGNLAGSVTEQKLFSADGAVMAYAPVTAGGATYWAKGSDVQFPSDIDGFDASGVSWKYGGQTVDKNFALTVENYGKYEFTAQLTINAILFPFEDGATTKVYDGKAWALPEQYANLLSFSVKDGKDTTDVGEYVLTVSLKNDGDKWSDSTNADKTVTLTVTPAEYSVVWKMTGDWKGNAKTYNGVSIEQDLSLKLGLNNEIEVTGDDVEIYDSDGNRVDSAVNAGEYRIVIKDEELSKYTNYTFVDTEQTLIINKRAVDISDPANLAFGLDGYNATTDLRDGWLYIYDDIPYISAQSDLGTPTIISVKKSYVRYRQDTQMTIVVNNIPNDEFGSGKIYSVAYDGNQGTAVGTYQATATLNSANYSFITTNTDSNELLARGLVIVINSDGTATVNKTWYIVRMENSLVDAQGNEYEITAGWTYGDNVDVVAPKLEYGTDEQVKTAIKISLRLNGAYVAEDFGVDQFNYYINSSMPAGNYDVIFNVDSIQVSGEAGDIMHSGFEHTFHISVATKTNAAMYADLNDKLQNATFEYKYIANRPQFLGELNAVDLVEFTYGTRQGFWNDPAASKYFSDKATITFNVEGMQSSDYRETTGYTAEDDYVPMNVGTYVVYYQVNVGSYTSLVANILNATSNRKDYKFTVIIYDELDIPTVSSAGLVYTGNKVLPDIENSELYAVVWSETDAYTVGGKHTVWFKLYDPVHYRWKGEDGDTVSVDFTVAKADNDFVVALNMLGWNFETFDAAVNNIRAATKFLDAGQGIHFKVVKKGETVALTGLGDFTIDANGRVNETVAGILNALAVGEYTLYATVNGTDNYIVLERNIDFRVSKAMNSWADGEEDLVLPSWIVGRYDPEENIIVVNAAHGTVNIIITDLDGNEFYNSVTGLNRLNECEVGKYLLKAWVDETDDYAALAERTFTIEVFEKAGLPWWAVLLIVLGSLGVAALILWILHEKGILQMLTGKIVIAMRTRMTVDATIAAVRANKRAEESRKSIAKAEAQDRMEAMRKKAAEQRALPPEERAAALEEKAAVEVARAEKAQQRADKLQSRAKRLKGNDTVETPVTIEAEPVDEVTATEQPTDDTDEQ